MEQIWFGPADPLLPQILGVSCTMFSGVVKLTPIRHRMPLNRYFMTKVGILMIDTFPLLPRLSVSIDWFYSLVSLW